MSHVSDVTRFCYLRVCEQLYMHFPRDQTPRQGFLYRYRQYNSPACSCWGVTLTTLKKQSESIQLRWRKWSQTESFRRMQQAWRQTWTSAGRVFHVPNGVEVGEKIWVTFSMSSMQAAKSMPKSMKAHSIPSLLYSSCSSTNMWWLKNCWSFSLVKLIHSCSNPLYYIPK